MLQNEDGRIVFAIPYEGRFTLIGTTDVPFEGDPGRAEASQAEIAYLCRCVSRYFRKAVIRAMRSGDMPASARFSTTAQAILRRSRATMFSDLDASAGQAPALSSRRRDRHIPASCRACA